MTEPLGRFDHIAIAVRNESKAAARRFMTDVLGAVPGFKYARPDFGFEHFHMWGQRGHQQGDFGYFIDTEHRFCIFDLCRVDAALYLDISWVKTSAGNTPIASF